MKKRWNKVEIERSIILNIDMRDFSKNLREAGQFSKKKLRESPTICYILIGWKKFTEINKNK